MLRQQSRWMLECRRPDFYRLADHPLMQGPNPVYSLTHALTPEGVLIEGRNPLGALTPNGAYSARALWRELRAFPEGRRRWLCP